MNGHYEVQEPPFFVNRQTNVKLFHGVSLKRNRQPVVIKRHDVFLGRSKTDFLEDLCMVLNTGLTQARLEHANSCKIIEFRVDVDLEHKCYTVFHILEAMERDLEADIEERKRPASEEELKKFLQQTSSALAYAHDKEVAHRDIKPGNIFVDRAGNFKVGDFGSFFEQTTTVSAQTVTGTVPYMSPQLREVFMGAREKYDAYKHDVFGLGLTAVSLATNSVLQRPWPLHSLQEKVRDTVDSLPYSPPLKDLLVSMLAVEEASRPSMQAVTQLLTVSTPSVALPAYDFSDEDPETAIAHYLESIEVFSVHFPQELTYAHCLCNLGIKYRNIRKLRESEANFKKAIGVYSHHFPTDIHYANCLLHLGSLYWCMRKFGEAEAVYKQAIAIYSPRYSEDINYANCLRNLGYLYCDMNRIDAAEAEYKRAKEIYSHHYPLHLDYAICLRYMGMLYGRERQRQLAIDSWETALGVYLENEKFSKAKYCRGELAYILRSS